LARNADSRISAISNSNNSSSSNIRDVDGVGDDKTQRCVTSHGRDTGSEEVTGDVVGDGLSLAGDVVDDAASELRRSANEPCDELMRLATEGQSRS